MDASFENFRLPHFVAPSSNVSINSNVGTEFISEYSTSSYSCSLPVPVGIPAILTEKCLQDIDHVTELVNNKCMWEYKKDELLAKINESVDCLDINLNQSRSIYHDVPPKVLKLAKHLDEDPDPNFSGYYNWYYSNGCLSSILYDDIHSLLYIHDNLPGICFATPLNIQRLKCNMLKESSVFLKTGQNQRIHEVTVNKNFVAVRQKNFTSLFSISSNERKLKFERIHQHWEDKESITSVSVSDDNGKYCSLTTSNHLKLWSPEVKDNFIDCVTIKNETGDNWGTVKYISNNILVSTRSHIYLKDPRTKLKKNAQKWKINGQAKCDVISLIINSSEREFATYVGTTHGMYELDFRQGLSKQWTHMMEFPPMYGAVTPTLNESEVIFVGSQNLNEICCIDSNLKVMPYILPSPDETINTLNLQGHYLDPRLSSRFHLSMTGMTALPNSKKDSVFVFRTNSVGDVFCQKVLFKEERKAKPNESDVDIKAALEWQKIVEPNSLIRDPLKVSNVINFDKLTTSTVRISGPLKPHYKHQTSLKDSIISRMCKRKFVVNESDNLSKSLIDVWGFDGSETYTPDDDDQCSSNKYINDTLKGRLISSTPYRKESDKIITKPSNSFNATNETITPIKNELTKTNGLFYNKDPEKLDNAKDKSGNEGNGTADVIFRTPKMRVIGKKGKRFSSGF